MKPRSISIALITATVLVLGVTYPAMAQQRIEPGSVLQVTVLGKEELSQTVTVSENGTTDYPVLGNLDVVGMTAIELTDLLKRVLSRMMDRPQVFVNLSETIFVNARVKGAVRSPGEVMVKAPADILDIIAEAGGATTQADLRRVKIFSENNEGVRRNVRTVDLIGYSALEDGEYDPILVHLGELVIVPTLEPQSFIRVLGEVQSPGPYIPENLATVVDLIYQAGGPTRQADVGDVRHIRRSGGEIQEFRYDLRDVLEEDLDLPEVEGGDVIIVGYMEDWQTLSFWVRFLRDASLLASSIVLLSRI